MPKKTKGKKKSNAGRPEKVTKDVVSKLEHVFSLGGNVTEACLYSGISRETYYKYLKKNPKFSDRVEVLSSHVSLRAKNRIYTAISNDTALAWKYLERKFPEEYGAQLSKRPDGNGKGVGMRIIFEDLDDDDDDMKIGGGDTNA